MKSISPKEVFNLFAKHYQDKFMGFDLYHDTFDVFCELVKTEKASVLEIGCGPGNITKYLLKKRPDFKLLGIDISENMIELAANNNPLAKFKLLDCKDITDLNLKFNAIMCGFTLPYLTKQETIQLIEDASEIILPNGILYLSTMEDYYKNSKIITSSTNKDIGLFTYYHQADYLKEAIKKSNFTLKLEIRKEYPEKKDTSNDLILIARKGLTQP